MIIQRMASNPNSYKVEGAGVHHTQKYASQPIEFDVLNQVERMLEPGESGEFEIIVRRKISQEVIA